MCFFQAAPGWCLTVKATLGWPCVRCGGAVLSAPPPQLARLRGPHSSPVGLQDSPDNRYLLQSEPRVQLAAGGARPRLLPAAHLVPAPARTQTTTQLRCRRGRAGLCSQGKKSNRLLGERWCQHRKREAGNGQWGTKQETGTIPFWLRVCTWTGFKRLQTHPPNAPQPHLSNCQLLG